MLARPTVTALVCRQCQRLATSTRRPGPALGWRALAAPRTCQRPFGTDSSISRGVRGVYWDEQHEADVEPETVDMDEHPAIDLKEWAASSAGPRPPLPDIPQVPWYLQVESPLSALPQHSKPLPEIPENCEPIVIPLLDFIHDDMGLDDIALLDLRDLDTHSGLGPNLIMILGTGRSERHIQAAGLRLLRWLQRERNVRAHTAGLISAADIKLKLRRLRKKQQLVGGSAGAFIANGKEHGLSTEWVVVNLGTLGVDGGESAMIDKQGRLSGFGSRPTGTTIVVQCLTESKRRELDLEGFWISTLESQKRAAAKYGIQMESEEDIDVDNKVSGPDAEGGVGDAKEAGDVKEVTTVRKVKEPRKVEGVGKVKEARKARGARKAKEAREAMESRDVRDARHVMNAMDTSGVHQSTATTSRGQQFLSGGVGVLPRGNLSRGHQQARGYSTAATPPPATGTTLENASSPRLAAITPRLNAMLMTPIRPDYHECAELIGVILTDHDTPEVERIELTEAVFQMMSERILPIAHQQVIAPIIVAVVRGSVLGHMATRAACLDTQKAPPPPSKSSMDFLARVQTNFETLMYELHVPCPKLPTLLDLIEAYAMQHNWSRCRATFDLPTLWHQDRDRRIYMTFMRHVTASGSPQLCSESVRHALYSLMQEGASELLNRELCTEFLKCIVVADPWAWNAVAHTWQDMGFKVDEAKVDGPSPGEGVRNWERRVFVNLLKELKGLWEDVANRS